MDRAGRLALAVARDGDHCLWCGRTFTRLVPPTTDHLVPRVKGGPSWAENEIAACRRCNAHRGHQAPAAWRDECLRRGWQPDVAALTAAVHRLAAAVDRRGGQRRAAQYLAGQLRRW
ncbi:HNH endonuclease [Nakamurella leprariae]|uniref:HNH endonuclease n=1 Tax=Nakamurella leprariae TaxID=2803911 RepID=UPI0038B272CC